MATQAVVQRACAKLRSATGDGAVVHLNFTGDMRELLEALEAIQPVLNKAEMHLFMYREAIQPVLNKAEMHLFMYREAIQPVLNKAEMHLFMYRDVSFLLQRVLSAAYKAIDTVDEMQDARPQAAATMTRRMLPRLAIMKNAMAIQVQETKQLVMDVMEYPLHLPGSVAHTSTRVQKISEQRKTGPVFEEAMVLGRGSDKDRIIATLLCTEPNIITQEHITIILPIFGLAGSGKTTLAQMVFNDIHSLQGYDFRVWVYVSPQFDFHTIGNSIVCNVSGRGQEEINNHSSPDVEGMESIMKRLHKLLDGKKVLLVLDDLWEEDPIQLQLLKSMLTFLGDKMDVIVTTCNQAIPRKICTVEPYRLNRLSDDTCWEIIKKLISFEGGEEELEKIGRKIASKCWGVPSIAHEYACMLGSSRDAMAWKETMEWDIWSPYISNHESTLMLARSTLELSYRSMPPELRLCFAYYCEIFPNGHHIVKYDLVHHWIALQLIEPSEILSATQIAEEHISRLQDLSFLHTAELDHASGIKDKGSILFTMHNLVRNFRATSTDSLTYCLATNCHGKPGRRYGNHLRAMRFVGCRKVEFTGDLFSRNKWLRVLELTESSVLKLPDTIWQLKHLGYLKISGFSGLVTLPESLGHLKNLFHIDLSGCSGLATLPESFGDLINLTHVNLSRCHGLAELPEQLQKLGKLVHLDLSFWSCFEGIGNRLGGLTTLEHLNLSNPCCHLAQQRSHLQGLKDGLCKLTKLRYLNLSACLNPIFYYHGESQEDSLKCLGECVSGLSSLEHLDLSHHIFLFGLPASLGDLNQLHTLDLSGCIRLKKVGEMKSLKFIYLWKCRGLESCQFMVRIIDDDDVYSSSNIVQLEEVNCQELQISCLEKVKSKEEAQRIKLVEKLKLQKLKLSWTLDSLRSVEDSALLVELVPPPNLQCLEVNGYTGTCLPEYLGELTSLQELKIVRCKQLNSLPDTMQKLTSLKDLCIFDCPELEKWCQVEENKKMLAHIPNKNYEEPASTSRQEIEEDDKSGNEAEIEEDKKMLAHIPNKNYEEPASTSRQGIEEDYKSGDKVEAA
ncbi:disease resistance protein RGA2-like [Triticum dicoccoides]|uniref:disease resistance protein RGA2-like n=1 Tax=Triticum dicoccoides TaxID=85692 RepID=UPI00188F6257|nr:disease resistance protein RGA2-like [Triticum dicoccoides]